MDVGLTKGFAKRLSGTVEKYEFEVGILEDSEYMEPVEGTLMDRLLGKQPTRTYAGGPVRKKSRVKSGKTVSDVFVENQSRLNIDLLRRPLQDETSDIMRFVKVFLTNIFKKGGNMKRVENLLQAAIRNPILNEEYGKNNSQTADNKGFNRHLFDTGQMFQSIKARAKRVRK